MKKGIANLYSKPTEYMPIDDTYSPLIHRINQAIRRRGVQPNEAVTPPAEILTKYSNPPSELVSESARQLEKLVEAADVKKGKLSHVRANPYVSNLLSQFPPKPKASAAAKRSPSPCPVLT
jgi:ATP-dependent DNA helicase 2 subunit 2